MQHTTREIQDALERLGLPRMVTAREVKRRYRELARRYHPDRPGGDAEKMRGVQEAYDLLREYMENFRFRFDEEEIARQFPEREHNERFKF
ncbi:J domain-containing protein [Nitratifractor sp.]